MAVLKGRIEKLEKNIRSSDRFDKYSQFIAIERWKYGFASSLKEAGELIFESEWNEYCSNQLARAKSMEEKEKIQQELNSLEKLIEESNGFIRIKFVSDGDTPTTK